MADKILKPNELDPDYLTDETGKYLLAVDEFLRDRSNAELAEVWPYLSTPLGSYRPLPQARKFHQSAAKRRWALGGNRSSKSRSLAVETVWKATGWHPYLSVPTPNTGWYATTTWPKLGELYREHLAVLLRGVPHRIIWHNRQFDIPEVIIVQTPDGESRIQCKAFEQGRESFQASAQHYIHFDEQFSRDIFVESITRIGAQQEADFAASMTPIESQPWLEERLVTKRQAGDAIFEFPLDDNRLSWGGFIPDERIDALIEEWPPEVRETRRKGKWGSFLGAIFQTFSRETHVVNEEREKRLFLLPGRTMLATIGSVDWGGSNPFGMIFAARVPHLDDDWYVYDEIYWDHRARGGRRLADLAADIKAKLAKWSTALSRCYADHDPTNVLEFRHNGIGTTPATKIGTQDEISRVGIEAIQTLLQLRQHLKTADWPNGRPRLHIAARCENLVREMALYRWQEVADPSMRSPKNIPLKVDDHLVDCLRYVVASESRHHARILDAGNFDRTFR